MSTAAEFERLEARLKTILPPVYQESSANVSPASMGSAGLKFGADGRVAWHEMWGSFCDLAMAGGPPHKGTLLQPCSPEAMAADQLAYARVEAEICRGIAMVTGLAVEPSPVAGWVRVNCRSHAMAGWLLRAITMENVAVRSCEGATVDLPVGPHYRLEKEIKNGITVIAKTCHYWTHHIPAAQQRAIGELLEAMDLSSPLLQPAHGTAWQSVEYSSISAAVWLMRGLAAYNVLARREGTKLFVPMDDVRDPAGVFVAKRLKATQAWAVESGIL